MVNNSSLVPKNINWLQITGTIADDLTGSFASESTHGYAPTTDSLQGDFESLGGNLQQFWDEFANRGNASSTTSTSTTASSTAPTISTAHSQHQQISNTTPLMPAASSASTTTHSTTPAISTSHSQHQQLPSTTPNLSSQRSAFRGVATIPPSHQQLSNAIQLMSSAASASMAAGSAVPTSYTASPHYVYSSIQPVAANVLPRSTTTEHSTNAIQTHQPSKKRTCTSEIDQQLHKKPRTEVHLAVLHPNSGNPNTLSSSSSRPERIFRYLQIPCEEHQPKENDYVAAGVNNDGTYDESMTELDDVWKKIQTTNVKWLDNIPYAWVRYYGPGFQLILRFTPVIPEKQKELGFTATTVVQNRSPYCYIQLLKTATLPSVLLLLSSLSEGYASFLHATKEDNEPNEQDYLAAGVNEDGTYYQSMTSDRTRWKQITPANVKWHNNAAYAWVKSYLKPISVLFLQLAPLNESKLKQFCIRRDPATNSPYPSKILICKEAVSINTSTSSQAPSLLGFTAVPVEGNLMTTTNSTSSNQPTTTSSSSSSLGFLPYYHATGQGNQPTEIDSSTSSSVGSTMENHAPEEANQPTDDDYEAAGVNRDKTYDNEMIDLYNRWKKIELKNVKWHFGVAYAWVKSWHSPSLFLQCTALPQDVLNKCHLTTACINSTIYSLKPLTLKSTTTSTDTY